MKIAGKSFLKQALPDKALFGTKTSFMSCYIKCMYNMFNMDFINSVTSGPQYS
jgi:hypothetical protein